MLTKLHLKNFKAWKDTGPIRLAPLTVIFGANSAGKSSLGHLLLALKQTALSTDRKRALHLGDASTLIDLGTFADCLHGHDLNSSLDFSLSWVLPKPLEVRDPLQHTQRYLGDRLELDVSLVADKSGQPEVQSLHYGLTNASDVVLDVNLSRGENRKFSLESDHYKFVKAVGRKWPLEEPEKFYRVSEISMARFENAGFLTDFALATETMLGSLSYLGPLRKHPQRTYQWSGDTPEGVGQMGENAIAAFLAAQHEGRKLNRGTKKANPVVRRVCCGLVEGFGRDSQLYRKTGSGRTKRVRSSGENPCPGTGGENHRCRIWCFATSACAYSSFLLSAQFHGLDGTTRNPSASAGTGRIGRRVYFRHPVPREQRCAQRSIDCRKPLRALSESLATAHRRRRNYA